MRAVSDGSLRQRATSELSGTRAFLYVGVGVEVIRGDQLVAAFPIEPLTGPDDPRRPVPAIELRPGDEE